MRKMVTRRCVRAGCKNNCVGQQQVCMDCRANDLLCKNPKCGKPHGGPPTTKLCPPCRAKVRGRKRSAANPPWTPEEDAKLREIYSTFKNNELGKKAREAFPGRPQWSIKRRASAIGAATVRRKEPPWSVEEDALLREIGWMTPDRIVLRFRERGFLRTMTAIGVRMKRFRVREQIDSVNANGLADLLGVDIHAVLRWIDDGSLHAERSGTRGDNHDAWHITTANIRTFLLSHPHLYTLTNLERAGSKDWFMDIVAPQSASGAQSTAADGERLFCLAGERVPLSTLTDLSGRSVATILRRIDMLGQSVEQAVFGPDDIVDDVVKTEIGVVVGMELQRMVAECGKSATAVAKTANVPALMMARLFRGEVPILPPLLTAVSTALGCEVRVELQSREGPRPGNKKRGGG